MATSVTLGIGHEWYLVSPGDAVGGNLAEQFALFASNLGGPPSLPLPINESVFLGFRLLGELGDTDYYGWAELEADGVTVEVLGGAYEDSGRGLFAGTLTVVPEPTVACLSLLGSLLGFRRRR